MYEVGTVNTMPLIGLEDCETFAYICSSLQTPSAWCAFHFQKIVNAHPHAVNCRDLDGRHSTPLHFAAGYNRVAVVDFLLQHGADVHAKDKG